MRMTLNDGDVPAWIASIGTVAAISVALFQIRTERKLRQKAEHEDKIERHKAQARLISAMPGPTEPEEVKIPWQADQPSTASMPHPSRSTT